MIESLANNEAILVMYLADELPPQDRAEVEQLLRDDSGLRGELEQLTAAWDGANEALASADATDEISARQSVVTQRIVRAMRQQQLTQAANSAAHVAIRGLTYPWWFYPAASAAAILLAFLTWWGNTGPSTREVTISRGRQIQLIAPNDASMADANIRVANEIERVFNTNDDADNALLALRDDRSSGLDLDGHE